MGNETQTEFDRRVYRAEFTSLLGYSARWFRTQELRGTIPQGRHDPGGKRKWWPASEVRKTLADLQKASVPATARAAPAELARDGTA